MKSNARANLANPPKAPLASDPVLPVLMAHATSLTGVQLHARHNEMIIARMHKRLSELSLPDLASYLEYLKKNPELETPHFVALVTTHHTYFFREFSHFEFLLNTALPILIPVVRKRTDKTLRVWSAACSRGQEAYSLAMFLDVHLKRLAPDLRFEILGSDVDAESVATAVNGVYPRQDLKEVPLTMLGDHWIRGTGNISEFVKAKKSLRDRCHFQNGNLFDLEKSKLPNKFDVIFCRNVFIYFNDIQIKQITNNLLKYLAPQGYFILGISESIKQLALPVRSVAPSVYVHQANQPSLVATVAPSMAGKPAQVTAPEKSALPSPIRVVCVDDSNSIITLLKRMLTRENGFEIVGTAANGKIAAEVIQKLKPDAVTLDIHMPEMTGTEYLEKYMKPGHPPVVMITSVSREDSELASKALRLGASDYVEKPTLNNIAERSDEIRGKLKCAVQARSFQFTVNTSLDQSFEKIAKIQNPEHCLRMIAFNYGDRARVKALLNECGKDHPPTILYVAGAQELLGGMLPSLIKDLGRDVSILSEGSSLQLGKLYATSKLPDAWKPSQKKTSIIVFGEVTESSARDFLRIDGAHLLLEDLGGGKGTKALAEVANDILPSTSFAYVSQSFFAETNS